MAVSIHDFDALARELGTLMATYGKAQARCSQLLAEQAAEIERLRAQAMLLRGVVVARETALAWAHQDSSALEQRIPDLATRVTLANRVGRLTTQLKELTQQQQMSMRVDALFGVLETTEPDDTSNDLNQVEASLVAADLVICRTGCLGHGDYWRVEDYCKRTGKTCILVDQPEKIRIVRIHRAVDKMVEPLREGDI